VSTLQADTAVRDELSDVAGVIGPALEALLGTPAVEIEFWDGSTIGRRDGPGRLRINSIDAIRRVIWLPGDLGLARAFVMGDIDVIGPLPEVLRAMQNGDPHAKRIQVAALPKLIAAVRSLGGIGTTPPPPPAEELIPRGRRHSLRRDKQVISHHYDVGNAFYEIVLGPAMTYSCARFVESDTSLVDAQAAKHDLICRKLGLHEWALRGDTHGSPARMLDVGCGWGSMAMHAAKEYGARVVGVTISDEQAAYARRRVADAGLDDLVEIRIQDYREVDDGPFDVISSVGMSEHVGSARLSLYYEHLYGLLADGGRLLNHAISTPGGSRLSRRTFIYRYVFPDGELIDVGESLLAMQRAGFEIRDVEDLREHYATTLRRWVANLEARWDEAVALVGEHRARVWQLYMSGSINGFDDAGVQLHQVLGVRNAPDGTSHMPRTRRDWN